MVFVDNNINIERLGLKTLRYNLGFQSHKRSSLFSDSSVQYPRPTWSLLRFQRALFIVCNTFHLASLWPSAKMSFPLHILFPLSSLQVPSLTLQTGTGWAVTVTHLQWWECGSDAWALCSRYVHCQEEASNQASIFHPDFHRFIGQREAITVERREMVCSCQAVCCKYEPPHKSREVANNYFLYVWFDSFDFTAANKLRNDPKNNQSSRSLTCSDTDSNI